MSVLQIGFVWETCCRQGCNVAWGMSDDHVRELRSTKATFYCPNGHGQHYTGQSDAEQLRAAAARETHLKDQLATATRNEEAARSELLRIRSRIANGVCPCCRRSFDNVRRHMATEHPTFAAPERDHRPLVFECSCGYEFDTFRGLRIHQGKSRPDNWDRTPVQSWRSHLTVMPR